MSKRIRVNGVLYEVAGIADWDRKVTTHLRSLLVGEKFGSYKVTEIPTVKQYDKGQDVMFAASATLTNTESQKDGKLLITILCGRYDVSIELSFLGQTDYFAKSRVAGTWEEDAIWNATAQLPRILKKFIPKAEKAEAKHQSDRSDALRDFQTESLSNEKTIRVNGVLYEAVNDDASSVFSNYRKLNSHKAKTLIRGSELEVEGGLEEDRTDYSDYDETYIIVYPRGNNRCLFYLSLEVEVNFGTCTLFVDFGRNNHSYFREISETFDESTDIRVFNRILADVRDSGVIDLDNAEATRDGLRNLEKSIVRKYKLKRD